MAEIINLRRARKAKERLEDAAIADANRVRHGRKPSEREVEAAEETRRGHLLDGAKLERPGADEIRTGSSTSPSPAG